MSEDLKPTTYVCDDTVRQRLIALRDGGLSNTKLAAKLGCSSTIISQWLAVEGNLYPAEISKWEKRAEDFLRNDARRRASGVMTCECESTKRVGRALELIRRTNDVGVIVAEAGFGKTRALEKYCEENPTAVLYTVKSWACDKGAVEGAVFAAAGSSGYDGHTKRAVFLANKFTGSDRLLLVDDAHKLTRPALQWLFDFADETQCPLGLVGTPELLKKIEDDAQRFSRVGLKLELEPKNWRDLIAHLVATHAPTAGTGAATELVGLCEQVVAQHGHFRALHKQLKLAAELKEHAKEALTWPQVFRKAHLKLVRKYQLN